MAQWRGKERRVIAQVWGDGAKFEGEFVRDTSHGKGNHLWPYGEVRKDRS